MNECVKTKLEIRKFSLSLSLSLCLSLSVSLYLSLSLSLSFSLSLSYSLSLAVSVSLSVCLCLFLSVCLSVSVSVSVCLSVCLSPASTDLYWTTGVARGEVGDAILATNWVKNMRVARAVGVTLGRKFSACRAVLPAGKVLS